ncbi:MAG: response regulator transcription factor [Planctomycetota bacterium]
MSEQKDKPTILVVDDDPDFLTQQQVQLQAAGYDVVAARSADEAIQAAQTSQPDLAVVDIMMAHMDDGFVLCYRLKKHRTELPVIVVTAMASETGLEFDAATEEERSWVKADVMLTKPVRFEQLRAEIERLLGK